MFTLMSKTVAFVAALAAAGLAHPGHQSTSSQNGGSTAASTGDQVPEIEFERYRLDNGLEVILHRDNDVPLVAVDVWYHVGSGNEQPGKSGFAHLFEHMMFQGAKHIGEDVHFDVLRQVGASNINGTTNPDRTNYFEVIPSHQLETALWLESDRMGYMLDLLNERSLANQIDVVRNERRQRYDNVPYGKERFALAAALYPEGHPYRYLTIGRHEDLEQASLPDVRAFFTKWYAPSNATLAIAGDFDNVAVKKLVDKWFGSFPTVRRPEQPVVAAPTLASKVRTEVEDSFARRPRIHYTWISPKNLARGDVELQILATVLGSDGWGRLYKRLVLQERLAQNVSAYQYGMNHSGEFHVVVDLIPGKSVADAERLVGEEIARVLAEPVTKAELQRAVNDAEAGFIWGLEDLFSRVERLQYFNHYAADPGYTKKYLDAYRSKTPAAILATAKDVLARPRAEVITLPGAPQTAGSDGAGKKARAEVAPAARQGGTP